MAESLLYTKFETPITFGDSGQSYPIALQNLAANAGVYSNRADRGAGSIATRYIVRARFRKGVASVVNEVIGVYIFTSDGTDSDGTLATTGTTLTTAMLPNAWDSFGVVVESTSTAVSFIRSRIVEIPTRYFTVGVMNSLTGLLTNTANTALISFTPIVDALQAQA